MNATPSLAVEHSSPQVERLIHEQKHGGWLAAWRDDGAVGWLVGWLVAGCLAR